MPGELPDDSRPGDADSLCDFWTIRDRILRFDNGPLLMGIVNVTPDSFSDGGSFASTEAAIAQARRLCDDGADIIDVGGESTRPGSTPVSEQQELDRVMPVIEGIAGFSDVPISIDTSKANVAELACAARAHIINDVTGMTGDPTMLDVAREHRAGLCVMHMQGTPQTMQDNPQYDDVVSEILSYLIDRKTELEQSGIDADRICLDPGIGFGKSNEHNLLLIRHIARFHAAGRPLLVGHSRKGFIKKLVGDSIEDRDAGSLGIAVWLALRGVQVIRLHDIRPAKKAIQMVRNVADSSAF